MENKVRKKSREVNNFLSLFFFVLCSVLSAKQKVRERKERWTVETEKSGDGKWEGERRQRDARKSNGISRISEYRIYPNLIRIFPPLSLQRYRIAESSSRVSDSLRGNRASIYHLSLATDVANFLDDSADDNETLQTLFSIWFATYLKHNEWNSH